MRVSLAYAQPEQQIWLEMEVNEGATVVSAINQSGILQIFPTLKLDQQKVRIFGKLVTLEATLVEGDRVEIYRPTTWQPDEEDEEDDD